MALSEGAARDLDETRRLLYMALMAGRTKRYNLAGTLINALRHHQGVDDPILEERVLMLLEAPENEADETWARNHIGHLTAELEGRDE